MIEDMKAYKQAHYQKNKELYKQRALESNKRVVARNRAYVQKIKTETPCADCDQSFHYCQMDFDHLDENKLENISCLVKDCASIAKIDVEISKCDVVCSNCHRLRTFTRQRGGTVYAADSKPVSSE